MSGSDSPENTTFKSTQTIGFFDLEDQPLSSAEGDDESLFFTEDATEEALDADQDLSSNGSLEISF